jgi:hypothetical protein
LLLSSLSFLLASATALLAFPAVAAAASSPLVKLIFLKLPIAPRFSLPNHPLPIPPFELPPGDTVPSAIESSRETSARVERLLESRMERIEGEREKREDRVRVVRLEKVEGERRMPEGCSESWLLEEKLPSEEDSAYAAAADRWRDELF